ncbi:hypothetical protein HPB51_028471 [Rhipicephalus microplus]|uniref:Uncharacterized protein n=1 Tax=Rhipicephalus microplus TaxID=6941 RepID=A0A9J6CXP3_RHIMP|nr:hypothetical protein HPB51_028471 [Rhipicephalus microplus]
MSSSGIHEGEAYASVNFFFSKILITATIIISVACAAQLTRRELLVPTRRTRSTSAISTRLPERTLSGSFFRFNKGWGSAATARNASKALCSEALWTELQVRVVVGVGSCKQRWQRLAFQRAPANLPELFVLLAMQRKEGEIPKNLKTTPRDVPGNVGVIIGQQRATTRSRRIAKGALREVFAVAFTASSTPAFFEEATIFMVRWSGRSSKENPKSGMGRVV